MAQEVVSAEDAQQPAWQTIVTDWSADKATFRVPWGKAMMWIFLLSDTFIFTCFLTGYMNVRISTTVPWPNPSEVFGLNVFGVEVPLLLIGIMTFDLITSSGTWRQAELEAKVPLLSYTTLADRVGAWPEYAIVALTLAAFAFVAIRQLPGRRKPTPINYATPGSTPPPEERIDRP